MPGEIDPIEEALASVIRASASPEVQEAQVLLLRRLALEGSVFPTRIPAPKNITELGGYLNLLEGAGEGALRTSALASALGLASPASLSWQDIPPSIGLGTVVNDSALANPSLNLPMSIPLRADFALLWNTAVAPKLAAAGARLPLWAAPLRLPQTTPGAAAPDVMALLGRVIWIAPSAALTDPDRDVVLVGHAITEPANALRVMLKVNVASGAAPIDWVSLVWDDTANVALSREVGPKMLMPIDSFTNAAGFTSQSAPSIPNSRHELSWGRLTNTSGLLAGVSQLGDELAAVWPQRQIERSAFAKHLDRTWSGTAFV
jgi:hypothetical protein